MIPSPGKDRGFTLIEILVVVIIIAIISSIGLMSMNLIGDDRELGTERDRLASLIEIAQDEAMMQGRELGLELMTSTYRFVEYDPYQLRWSEITGDDLFRLRQLPDGMEFQLYLEDKLIVLQNNPQELEQSTESESDGASDNYLPHIFLFSSGELTPYEIHLFRPMNDQHLAMRSDMLGEIEFLNEFD